MTSVDRIQGLSGQQAIKTPVKVTTTAAITLSGEQTIDGVAVVEGDRVLVKDQADTTANGIYDASSSAWTRSLDFDGASDITDGTMVLVSSGTTYADKVFKLNATAPVTIGTTALTFNVAADFTSISAFAATLLDDADAAAARTTLGLGTAATAASGDFQPVDDQLTELAAISPVQGDIIYHNGTDWVKLVAGVSGHFLKTQGAAANPVWAAQTTPLLSTTYDSGDLTIALAGAHTLTHSLGGVPKVFNLLAKCIAVGGDAGYAQDEVIVLATNGSDAAGSNYGVSMRLTATQIILRVGGGSANSFTNYLHATTGAINGLDYTKWALIVRAYA